MRIPVAYGRNGWSPSDASALISVVQRPTLSQLDVASQLAAEYDASVKNNPGVRSRRAGVGNDDVLVGGMWMLGGIGLTVAGYAMTESHGGTYMVFYGAIAYGAIRVIRGIFA